MTSLLDRFDTTKDFRKLNPQFVGVMPEASSDVMWVLALLYDSKSIYRNLSIEERKKHAVKHVFKDQKFDLSKWKKAEDEFLSLVHTPARKQLFEWERLMHEKNTYMSSLKYNEDTADEIEKRLLSNSKLFEEYEKILSRMVKEEEEGTVKGGVSESLSEKGLI